MTDQRPHLDPLQAWVRALERSAPAARPADATLRDLIEDRARSAPSAPALLSDGICLSYAALLGEANRWARWALGQGLQRGDAVCLLMENCPAYIALWLGIASVGCVAALLNTNLEGASLAACARAAAPRHIIGGAGFSVASSLLAQELAVPCWHVADGAGAFLPDDASALGEGEKRPPLPRDIALLIYTSGTTGLPKAARISHARLVEWSLWFSGMMNAGPDDRMYNCLPLYHSVGGVVAVGALLVSGGSVAIRPGFSASRFWDDLVAFDCTLFQYIGELCRYLVNTPAHPRERAHRLRLCCGNGLRGEVWERFRERFEIPAILEFYAATEGNVALYNCEGRPGAIGRVPGFLAHRFGVALVRLDPATGEPWRDDAGRCVACAADEPGEAIGRIARGNFEGYTDPAATERKILRDAFASGDAWFRTGDLMRKDAAGFYVFLDRLGDTFRWKGENVSTTEIADVVGACPGIGDAVVFGVLVPRSDGRAGMAAIAVDAGFDLAALRRHIHALLPDYARPRFVRVCRAIERTGTFKLSKAGLAAEGYGINAAGDVCYVDDPASGGYVALDTAMRARIADGMRL